MVDPTAGMNELNRRHVAQYQIIVDRRILSGEGLEVGNVTFDGVVK